MTTRGVDPLPRGPRRPTWLSEADVCGVSRAVAEREQKLLAGSCPGFGAGPRERVAVGPGVVGDRAGGGGRVVCRHSARAPSSACEDVEPTVADERELDGNDVACAQGHAPG